MNKLAILKVGEGSFQQGFPVTFQIGEEGARATIEVSGWLPAAPEMPLYYTHWQESYRRLGLRSRLTATPTQVKNISLSSLLEECRNASHTLRARFNTWLKSEEFSTIREKWLEQLHPRDTVRVILQTGNSDLRRLPWHLLDLLERYPKAEIALSTPTYEPVPSRSPNSQVNLLAILGNSDGIDIQADQAILQALPQANVNFLVEPERKALTDHLWGQAWDILFFAGHSSSQSNDETGRIYLNKTDSLSIGELRYALRKAVDRGLKLAIFNSCDGLGLARELADLQIPQIIVMREPVPDRVAQEFLKYFLEGFSRQEPLYLAVREARERLQGMEDLYPCATWLPLICQNPAEDPPTWNSLVGWVDQPAAMPLVVPDAQPRSRSWRRGLWTTLATGLVATGLISGVRSLGWLKPVELNAYDYLLQKRPDEGNDPRLLLVTIGSEDIEAQQRAGLLKPGSGISLSDRSLSQLLTLLNRYQPAAIGLDLYRDFTTNPTERELSDLIAQTPNLIGVCKVSAARLDAGIAPPKEIPPERQGFSDFLTDDDEVVRRQLVFMPVQANSRCQTGYALSSQLAFQYLISRNILPDFTPAGVLKLGKLPLPQLQSPVGGYQALDTNGGQLMLNYRATKQIAETVSLSNLLSGSLDQAVLQAAIKDKVVLIGALAPDDRFATPYGRDRDRQFPGVVVHAHMTSQLLSTVLDDRPLLQVISPWLETMWIAAWGTGGAAIAWLVCSCGGRKVAILLRVGLAIGLCSGALYLACVVGLIRGYWLPWVPSALALVIASGTTTLRLMSHLSRSPLPPTS
jgi:CHASE2 domain-containing sensor protein